ncbi:MAG: DUF1329 domain-containing protein [Candidatus Binataceae bacterium]
MNRSLSIAALLALFIIAYPAVAGAQVKPGDAITPANASKVADLVSPGNYVLVRQGMAMNIVAAKSYPWPPPYKQATEQYSPQVKLDRRGSLKGYTAGLPFPILDPNDPQIARKVMWNFQYGPSYTDDLDSQNDLIVSYAPGHPGRPFESYPVGHLAVYRNLGRTEVSPVPSDRDYWSGIMQRTALGPIIIPIEPPFWQAPWTSFEWYRYASPKRGDLVWNGDSPWTSNSTAGSLGIGMASTSYVLENAFLGNLDLDSLFGFAGNLTDWDFKFLGIRNLLACVHAKTLPAKACVADGGRTICPEDWEMRRVYVVEADAKRAGHFGDRPPILKRILYIDSEGWFITASDQYDHGGQLWKTLAIFNTVRDREFPDSKVSIFPYFRLFQTAMVDEDVQSGYSTIFFTPNPERPERDTWFINQGVISPHWIVPQRFTTYRQYFY